LGIVLGHPIFLVNVDLSMSPALVEGEVPIASRRFISALLGSVAFSRIIKMCIQLHLIAQSSKMARKTSILMANAGMDLGHHVEAAQLPK